ncbi:hypothetical protein ACJX0J_013125, partial [Zea mays]
SKLFFVSPARESPANGWRINYYFVLYVALCIDLKLNAAIAVGTCLSHASDEICICLPDDGHDDDRVVAKWGFQNSAQQQTSEEIETSEEYFRIA